MSRSFKTQAVICLLLAALLCFAPAVSAASWTILVPADYISDTYYAGNYRYVLYDFHRSPYIAYRIGSYSGSSMNYVRLLWDDDTSVVFNVCPLGTRVSPGPPLSNPSSGQIAIDVSDFKDSAALSLMSNLKMELDLAYYSYDQSLDERFSVGVSWIFHGYNAEGNYVGSVERQQKTMSGTMQDVPGGAQYILEIPVDLDLTFSEFSSTVRYIVPYCDVSFTITEDEPDIDITYVNFSCDSFSLTTRTDMLLKDSLTLEAIEGEIGDLNDKIDDTNEKLDDIIQQPQNEKEEATQEGDKFVNQLTGVIPNDNQGFLNAITELAAAMSYEGTEAKLSIPAISLPAIPGVMKGYKLTDAQEVDFGFWIQKIPDKILTLVQVLGTLGLVVYSFKELYGLISYAMTLKGGKSDG